MAESAQKRGKELLERYQEEKHSVRKASRFSSPIAGSATEDFQDGRFEAIANGSLLGMCYSESKKKERNSTPKVGRSPVDMKLDESDEDLGADSPLEMVRFALLQLSALEEGSAGGSVANIASLLQGVEEYLEKSNSRMLLMNSTATPRKAGKVNTKLGFSVERPRRSGSETGNVNPEDDILNQSTYTPIKADQSSFAGYRTQRSIFMENQLDLNESEMEYYENIVNDLAEKLERMQEEKEDLQSISNSLGDRLQRLSQQKEEALLAAKDVEERRLAMEARVADLEASLTAKIQDLDKEATRSAELESSLSILRAKIKDDDKKLLLTSEENASLSAQVSKLTEEVQIITSLQKDEAQLAKRQLNAAEKAAETLKTTVENLTKSRQEMADRLLELEHNSGDVTQVRLQLTDAHQSETQLRSELNTLRTQHEKTLQQEKEKHRQVLQEANKAYQQLQERLASVESAAAHTSKASAAFSSPSKRLSDPGDQEEADEVVAELREKIQDLEAKLEDSQREVDSLSEVVEDLRMKISTGEDAASSAAAVNISGVQADSSELDVSVIRLATSPSGKHVHRVTTTAHNLASNSLAQNGYMENQLDLNESELQYYEEVVNELGNQLDTARAKIVSVTAERDELLDAREALQETIDELQAALLNRLLAVI